MEREGWRGRRPARQTHPGRDRITSSPDDRSSPMTTDPRFDGGHLEPPRRDRYEDARDGLFGSCGELTSEMDRLAAIGLLKAVLCPALPPDVPYALRDVRTGHYFPLRVGLTA